MLKRARASCVGTYVMACVNTAYLTFEASNVNCCGSSVAPCSGTSATRCHSMTGPPGQLALGP